MKPSPTDQASKMSAGYGRSCTNCSRAKCKCILNPGELVCERCSRLEKDCVPMTSSRRKSSKKPGSSRTAQLEEKLDDLVSILRASQGVSQQQQQQQQQPQSMHQHQHHPSQSQPQTQTLPPQHHRQPQPSQSHHATDSQPSYSPSHTSQHTATQHQQLVNNPLPSPSVSLGPYSKTDGTSSRLDSLATAAASSSAHTKLVDSCGNGHEAECSALGAPMRRASGPAQPTSTLLPTDTLPEPTPGEAEEYYAKFKTWMKNFPFLSLPPEQTAEELHKDRPFLWLCIMNITSLSIPQINTLRDSVREQVGKRIVLDGEKNLDLLQGLILYVAWSSLNAGPSNTSKHFLILYSQLACSLLYEMGMGRSPLDDQYFTGSFKVVGPRLGAPKMRTMEERRTLLALWYMTSVTMSFFGKMDTMKWSNHMQDCLQILDRTPEFPSDQILSNLIKVQLLADETHNLLVRDVMGDAETPTHVFKKGLLHRLRQVRENIPPTVFANLMVRAQVYATEVMILSLGLYRPDLPSSQRVEGMYQCLKAIQAWYDVFFTIPLEEMIGMPLVLFVQLSQTHVALYKLTTVDEPTWDKEIVRNQANLLVLLDQTTERFLQAGTAYKFRAEADQESLFTKGARMMMGIKASWEPILSQHLNGLPTPNSHFMPSANMDSNHAMMNNQQANHISPAMNLDPVTMDFNDMAWMYDIFGPWEL